jgi:hypothetical protein
MATNEKHSTNRSNPSSYDGTDSQVHVHTFEWPGQQQVMINTKNGSEMLRIRGPNGVTVEMTPTGGWNQITPGDSKVYNKAGSTSTTDENSDSKTTGHSRNMSGGGTHSETAGDGGSMSGGHIAIVVMGRANIRCQQAYVGTDGDLNMNVGGSMNMKVAGDTTMETGGTHTVKAAKITMNP